MPYNAPQQFSVEGTWTVDSSESYQKRTNGNKNDDRNDDNYGYGNKNNNDYGKSNSNDINNNGLIS